MKGIKFFLKIFVFTTLASCLPDSLTDFNEDPPSDPYAVPPSYTTDIPTGNYL